MRDPFDVPAGNISSHWEPEPNTRGTWSILSTCLLTMALCVWSALHINIPEPDGQRKNIARKAWWVFLGVFAPEMIALSAVNQNLNARYLTAGMRKLFRQNKPCSSVKNAFQKALSRLFGLRQAADESFEMDESHGTGMPLRSNAWTMTYSHYALMGGYAISDLSPSSNLLPNRRARLALTPVSLLFLAEHYPDLVPDLPEEEILDKSKASSLAKAIVCIQASWFCIQCISRLARGLPVSLLELNTFGHSICALIIYLQWWNKPLDISVPSIISISGNEGLFCAMIMKSAVGQSVDDISEIQEAHVRRPSVASSTPSLLDWKCLVLGIRPIPSSTSKFQETLQNFLQVLHTMFTTKSGQVTTEVCVSSRLNAIAREQSKNEQFKGATVAQECIYRPINATSEYMVTTRDFYMPSILSWKHRHDHADIWRRGHLVERFGILGQFKPWRFLTLADVTRLKLANSYCRGEAPRLPGDKNFVTDRIGDFLASDGIVIRSRSSNLVQVIMVTIPTFLYGVTHIIAWNAPFSSRSQSMIWRVSGVTLFIPTVFSSLFVIIVTFSSPNFFQIPSIHPVLGPLAKRLLKYLKGILNWILPAVLIVVGVILVISTILALFLYIIARVFLIVECFISLTYVPYTVFTVPNWSSYFPHIG